MEQNKLEYYTNYIIFENNIFVVYEFKDKLYSNFMHFITNLLKNAPDFVFEVIATKKYSHTIKVLLRKDTLEWFE